MSRLILKSFWVCCFTIVSFCVFSQSDSTEYKTYDVIYLKKGGALKGEILSFDEEFGGIVFKDQAGRTYSLGREEYDYFVENQQFRVKKKNAIRDRKAEGFEVSIGLAAGFININQDFSPDETFVNAQDAISDLPLGLKLAAGKYLNKSNYLGFTADVPLISESKNAFNAGVRYIYKNDAHKKNAVFYIPIELKYGNMKYSLAYSTSDTTFTNGGYEWPSNTNLDVTFNTLNVNLGAGVSFVLENKKSLNLEVNLVNHVILSQKFDALSDPNSDFRMVGLMLAALYSF